MTTRNPDLGRTRRRRIVAVLPLGACVLLSACGTRLSGAEAQGQLKSLYAGIQVLGAEAATGSGDATSPDGTTTDGGSGGAGGTSGPVLPGGSSGSGSGSGTGGSTGPAGGSGTGSVTKAASGSGKKSPIKLGMIGVFSGIGGVGSAPGRDAVGAWASTVNARGGIDGHPVKVYVADDQGSASNDVALARHLVEDEKVIALVYTYALALEPLMKYAESKNIPMVGGSGFEPEWTKHKGAFPLAAGIISQDTVWAIAMKAAGHTKVGDIYCSEAQICADHQKTFAKAVAALGLQLVYNASVSIAAPNYTSQCTQAQVNGATAMVTILDGGGTVRFARDCDQQGFHPLIVDPNPTSDTPSYMNGVLGVTPTFPWFLTSGSPALDEYGAAVKKYLDVIGATTSSGWIAGKAMEKALTGRVSEPPTSADVFAGMYSFKKETLGGLYPPGFTFTKGAFPSEVKCVGNAVVKDGRWVAPTGAQPKYCAP